MVPMKGFRFVNYISFPFPKLLGASDVTEAFYGTCARFVLQCNISKLFELFFVKVIYVKVRFS
jgi:hypothetical protein